MTDGDDENGPSTDDDGSVPVDGSGSGDGPGSVDESAPVSDETASDSDKSASDSDETASDEGKPASDTEPVDDGADSDAEGESETENEMETESESDEESETEEAVAGPAPEITDPVSDGGGTQRADAASGGAFKGAPDDEEMPLTAHIEEMIRRLAVVIVIMAVISLIVFPVAPRLINWLWYSFLPGNPEACVEGAAEATACPRVYHPLGLLFARLKVASLAGFIVALPVFVYETYLFMRPGLYPHERRYYLAAVPTSLLLAFVGLAFAYFLVLPFIFTYFLFYSEDVAEIAFGLSETFNLILLMLGLFAAIFQIPLFIMLAIMMGVTSRRWLEEKRYYFWLGFAGFAFFFSPDPTGMAPFIVGVTMVALYELTLLLLRWTGR